MRAGVIGIGNMGRGIAARLIDQGHEVAIWNRTPEKAQGIAGTDLCATPAEVVAKADVILSILANDAAIDAVYGGDTGLCSATLAGKVLVEMCTTSPETTRDLEVRVTDGGGLFLECPVGGTIGPAREGKLLGLAGGTDAAFVAAAPVLNDICRRLEHLGPVGTGAAMKLAINLPLMVYWGAVGEAIGLALGEGVDSALAMDILADSSGAIGAAKTRLPPIGKFMEDGNPGGVSLSMANGIKDMKIMEALAKKHGIASDIVSAARGRAEKAANAGWADIDTPLYGVFGQAEVKQ
ncbi:NAD(P)-dependent oxidoreductase [bacterium]|nr:NAD(P)-dependent oxidoreductase [bacterium]